MEPKLIEHLRCKPADNGILWIKLNQPERMNDLVGTAEENGSVAEVGDMRAGDDDSDIRVVVLTLIRLLSACRARCESPGKSLFSEPTAVVQSGWQERVFVPHSGPSRAEDEPAE